MNQQKTKHGKKIIGLAIVTLLITAVVLYLYKTQPAWLTKNEPGISSGTVTDSTAQDELPALPQTQESTEATDLQWTPSILYDAYTPSEIAQQNFNDTVILGNSQAQALSNFGLVKNADFVTKVGLSINRVLTNPDGEAPIRKLEGKSYRKAVFVFGENELGWPYPENFTKIYKQVIARVREMNPGVEVYVQGIFPVTTAASDKSTTGITNENVIKFNNALVEMCDAIDATFMPVTDAFRDETGALPEDASFDGVHFGYDLCKVWAGDLSAYIGSDETETTTEPEPETEAPTAQPVDETATMEETT